jgi:hypothetical protein
MSTLTTVRHRERAPRHAAPVADAGTAMTLELAAAAARRNRTIAMAVRSAWDVLVAATDSRQAFAAWSLSLGHAGPVEDLFGTACLAANSPGNVAASLYRAAAQSDGRAAA